MKADVTRIAWNSWTLSATKLNRNIDFLREGFGSPVSFYENESRFITGCRYNIATAKEKSHCLMQLCCSNKFIMKRDKQDGCVKNYFIPEFR